MPNVQVFLHSAENEQKFVGDVLLTWKEDFQAKQNRAERHPNFGYSGYINVRVWNGKHWCWLAKESKDLFSTDEDRKFPAKKKIDEVMGKLQELIIQHRTQHGWKVTSAELKGKQKMYWSAKIELCSIEAAEEMRAARRPKTQLALL